MKIGLFYATYSGGTQAAAEFLSKSLESQGHEVETKMILETNFEDTLNYDLRIFASPTWDDSGLEGQPHQDFIAFMNNSAGKNYLGKKCAIMGLGDVTYTHFCGAVDILENFVNKVGGKIVAPSLKIDGYLFDTEKNNGLILDWIKKIIS